MYRINTYNVVVKFLKKRKSCFISELCYLGKDKMQIKYPVVLDIVDDLRSRKLVKVEKISFGKRTLFKICWVVKQ